MSQDHHTEENKERYDEGAIEFATVYALIVAAFIFGLVALG